MPPDTQKRLTARLLDEESSSYFNWYCAEGKRTPSSISPSPLTSPPPLLCFRFPSTQPG